MPTIPHRLSQWAREKPRETAQRYKVNGQWQDISAQEFFDRCFHFALFMESKGFKKGDVSAIFGMNSPEWVQIDIASHLLSGISAGIYPNASAADVDYILKHNGAKILAVQNQKFYEKSQPAPSSVEVIVAMDDDTSYDPKLISFSAAIAEGKKIAQKSGKIAAQYLDKLNPHDPAYLIYTSGTTGSPKGALLSQDNLVFQSDAVIKGWNLPFADGSLISFLPLCHIAEKLQAMGVAITNRYSVSFASAMDKIAKELPEVQPTLLLNVPRLYEKMMEGATAKLSKTEGLQKKVSNVAFWFGRRNAERHYDGSFGLTDLIPHLITDSVVLSRVREALGMGRIKVAASGAAALNDQVVKWYRTIGIHIQNTYAQTESGVVCMTRIGEDAVGTVGRPSPGVEVRIAEDGEILTRGRHVFLGYLHNEEATKNTIKDGWLHTGDLAEFSKDGQVRIKGRKKEIMKSSGGKMVAPLPIEEKIKESEEVSQVCMVGDGRKYFTALVTLEEEKLNGHANKGRIVDDHVLETQVKGVIEGVNQSLASYEKIKYFKILSNQFSIEKGEMTPTLKMKRSVIEENYRDVIDSMYNAPQAKH